MKRKLSVVLAMVVALTLISIVPVSAKAPLTGEMELDFNLGFGDGTTPFPQFSWVGTVTIDGHEYGMSFEPVGTGKPFSSDPNTTVHFFEEIWTIYEGEVTFDGGVLTEFDPGPVVLRGYDVGITNLANNKYHMNGSVEEAASPFEEWVGRNVHMSGDVLWYPFGAPQFAPGTFRIN